MRKGHIKAVVGVVATIIILIAAAIMAMSVRWMA